MSNEQILSARIDNSFILKLVGDVRVPLCKTLDECVQEICSIGFDRLIIDFSEATNADSTTLGLIAKLCIRSKECCQVDPVLYAPNDNMQRLLQTMCMDQVATLWNEPVALEADHYQPHAIEPCDNESALDHVIEAHRILMSLSENNNERFADLVAQLESCETH